MSPHLSGLIGLNVHPMCWGINKLKKRLGGFEIILGEVSFLDNSVQGWCF